jgi:thiol-disulfide isomerase/thioredoxin
MANNMRTIITLLMLLTVTGIQAAGAAELKPYTGTIQTPGLALKDLQGKTHNLDDYKDQVVLVQFWASYCAPCRTEMPSMNRLRQKLKGKPFKILAVNMAEETSEVRAFAREVKPEFTILLDTDGSHIQQWKVFAAPANFIIGRDGKIKYTLYGGVEWDADEIVATLTQLMN